MKDRIKSLRIALGLTQEEFSARLHIKRNTIAKYETGRGEPIDAVISLISREYNVSESWLRTGEGEMFISRSREEEIAEAVGRILTGPDEFKRRWISMFCRMPDEYWSVLEDLVRRCLAEYEEKQEP